jgi:hypothetical protein
LAIRAIFGDICGVSGRARKFARKLKVRKTHLSQKRPNSDKSDFDILYVGVIHVIGVSEVEKRPERAKACSPGQRPGYEGKQ